MNNVSAATAVILAIVAVVGTLAGALLGPIVAAGLAARNAASTRRFEMLVETCIDGMAYLNRARAHIESFYSPDTWPEEGKHQLQPPDMITSRIDLCGPKGLDAVWRTFITAYWKVYSERMTDVMGSERQIIQPDDPVVVAALDTIDLARQALRKAVGTRGTRISKRPPE